MGCGQKHTRSYWSATLAAVSIYTPDKTHKRPNVNVASKTDYSLCRLAVIDPSPHTNGRWQESPAWRHRAPQANSRQSRSSVARRIGLRGCRAVTRPATEPVQLRRTVDAANQPPPDQQEQAISHPPHQRAWCSSERRNSSSWKMLDVPLSGGWLIQHPRGNTPAGSS